MIGGKETSEKIECDEKIEDQCEEGTTTPWNLPNYLIQDVLPTHSKKSTSKERNLTQPRPNEPKKHVKKEN